MDNIEEKHLAYFKLDLDREKNNYKGETSKARARRLREGWFEKYAPEDKSGIDLGCAHDPLNHTFRRFDYNFGDGDATTLDGVPNNSFFTVIASHLLEHLQFPEQAVKRWFEILKPEGHLIIIVPDRDLYEKKRFLPSRWNPEHTYFWKIDEEESPCTKSLRKVITTSIPEAEIVSLRLIDDGYDYSLKEWEHPIGEYSIECIVKKIS